MKETFPFIETLTIKDREYIHMKSEVFYSMFISLTNHMDIDDQIVNLIKKEYEKARKIKKQRIRFKKEKPLLKIMYSLLALNAEGK
jgi:hypothetical protein